MLNGVLRVRASRATGKAESKAADFENQIQIRGTPAQRFALHIKGIVINVNGFSILDRLCGSALICAAL